MPKSLIPNWVFNLTTVLLITACFLSLLSWLGICIEHCSASRKFLLLGVSFPIFGLFFFPLLLFTHFLSYYSPKFEFLFAGMVAAALGAELWFIAIQKFQMGQWCPLCLGIAACIGLIFLLRLYTWFTKRGDFPMKSKMWFSGFSAVIGFLVAVVGVTRPNEAEAAVQGIQQKLAFGDPSSDVHVYFVTDWFCPSCSGAEPEIEKAVPQIEQKAALTFIDLPVHRNSLNFTPYHLAFAVNNKKDYFKARHALADLTKKTDSPTDQDIEAIAAKNGLNFQELAYLDVKAGIDYFDRIVNQYKINATPTVIVTNTKTKATKFLEGSNQITDKKIVQLVDEMRKTSK